MRRDLREIPARQTTIPAISQCTLSQTPDAPPSARLRCREPAVSRPRPGHNAGVLPMVDGSGAPWFRSMVEGVIRIFPGRGGFRGFEAPMGSSGPGILLRRFAIAVAIALAMAATLM